MTHHQELAEALRLSLAAEQMPLSRSKCLDLTAALYGTDWNTLSKRPELPAIRKDKALELLKERLTHYGIPVGRQTQILQGWSKGLKENGIKEPSWLQKLKDDLNSRVVVVNPDINLIDGFFLGNAEHLLNSDLEVLKDAGLCSVFIEHLEYSETLVARLEEHGFRTKQGSLLQAGFYYELPYKNGHYHPVGTPYVEAEPLQSVPVMMEQYLQLIRQTFTDKHDPDINNKTNMIRAIRLLHRLTVIIGNNAPLMDVLKQQYAGKNSQSPEQRVLRYAEHQPLPFTFAIQELLGLVSYNTVHLDLSKEQNWLDELNNPLLDDENDTDQTPAKALTGLAENLDDWAEYLEPQLPGLSSWAEDREVTGHELAEWITEHHPGTHLVYSEFLERGSVNLGAVELHPGLITALWGSGASQEQATQHLWTLAYQGWKRGILAQAQKRDVSDQAAHLS